MAKLLNIKTNLSEHLAPQYGYDRRGAGPRKTNASGQPYEVQEIPKRSFNESDYDNGTGPKVAADFLLRGGQLLPEITARDVSRLTKMFTDLKSPNGLLFTAKQEVLSRTGVNVLAVSTSEENPKNRRAFNNGIYLPTSTIAQAAVNAIGGHLLKQGIDPTASTGPGGGIFGGLLNVGNDPSLNPQDPLGNPTYFSTVAYSERRGNNTTTSRLVGFTKFNVNANTDGENELYNYSGGPGSVLGVGRTSVKMLNDQRTGANNPVLNTSEYFNSINFGYFNYSAFKRKTPTFEGARYFNGEGVSNTYEDLTGTNVLGDNKFKTNNDDISGGFISNIGLSVFQRDPLTNKLTFNPQSSEVVPGLGTSLDYNKLMSSKPVAQTNNEFNLYGQTQILQDFRTKLEDTPGVTADSLDYTKQNIETRVNLGNPGTRNTSISYVKGNIDNKKGLDKINAQRLYQSKNVRKQSEASVNDLCTFRIGVIDNDTPSLKTYIHFRAFLDSMDDSYTAEWSAQKFAGRAENLYNYQGFDRKFNISWTVAAQSKQELIPMYQKLNYLASVCAPDYSSNGYMRGNLITLTVGGYLHEQVGIMTGINYTIPMESPWEIAVGSGEDNQESDRNVKQLPFMIKVSGFSFIPIHDFVPRIQQNKFLEGDLEKFGKERYIALNDDSQKHNYTKTGNSSGGTGVFFPSEVIEGGTIDDLIEIYGE